MSRVSLRPLPWVASILYGAVLLTGGYYLAAGLAPIRPGRAMVFVVGLVALFGLELVERRRYGLRTPRRLAAGLLAVRLVLYLVLSTVDPSGSSRVLFLLLPFTAYFSLGRRVAYGLGLGCVALVLVSVARTPSWYRDPAVVSDLLMFFIGLVFAISMAAVAAEEEASRARAERLLVDLEESHRQLTAYASQAATMATVTERNRLARDIHDSLGHHLTAVCVQLEKAAAFRHRDETTSEQALTDARRAARYALQDVRHSVGTLRSGFSLDQAVRELARGMGRTPVELEIGGSQEPYRAPVLMALYRAVQEALTNVEKHAAATRVSVRLDLGDTAAHLCVADDGLGFVPSTVDTGFGLTGMRERLEVLGGTVSIDSTPGRGTRLVVCVPAS